MDDEAQRKELGERIDASRRKKGLTLAEVAQKSLVDERTLRNVISGKSSTVKTVKRICDAVGVIMDSASAELIELSDENHGGYSNRATKKYLGYYLSFRWSFDDSKQIIRSLFEFYWSPKHKCMRFSENQSYKDRVGKLVDFSQSGDIYTNDDTGLLHLLTMSGGSLRLISLAKNPPHALRGVVLTQSVKTFYQQPALSPMLLLKMDASPSEQQIGCIVGELLQTDPEHAEIARQLKSIEHDVAQSTFSRDIPRRRLEDLPKDGLSGEAPIGESEERVRH